MHERTGTPRLAALHDEIARLPDRYREPIVLCHLEGLSTAVAAQRLGCPQGTILSRLARGRARLRQRLSPHGQVESMGLLAGDLVPPEPTTVVPAAAGEFHRSIRGAPLSGARPWPLRFRRPSPCSPKPL